MMSLQLRITLAGVLISSAAIGGSAAAAPIEPLQPMAFLAGHCWKGEFRRRQGDRRALLQLALRRQGVARHPHRARAGASRITSARPPTTTIRRAKRVEYIYIENLGGISRGNMQSTPEALVFPATQYVADGQAMTYRVRWTRLSDTSYEAWSEMQGKDGWTTMFKLTMKRSS